MKQSMSKKLFLFLVFLPLFLSAQDSTKVRNFVVSGYVKDMQTFILSNVQTNHTWANLIHNRLNFKWFISPSFTASLELRNRFLFGNMLRNFQGYNKTFEIDNGIISLSKNLIDQSDCLLNTTVDRLWLQYSSDKFQVTLGRQRINWGQTFVWNPNDIFNSYSFFDFDYEEKPGSDAVRMQYYSSPTSVIELAAKSNNQHKATIAGLYRFNKWNYDLQFIGGVVDQTDMVIGTGWSGQLGSGGFRGEASYFIPTKCLSVSDSVGIFLASIGYDYTFKNSLFLQLEVLYNGNNKSTNVFSLDQLSSTNLSAKNLFLPDFSIFFSLSYPISPLVNCSLAGVANPKNELCFIIPSISFSLKENLELSLTSQIIRSLGVSNLATQNYNFIYARLKQSF
ncbi:MAG TPA: hypothetical protein VJ602_02765 [Paludibacter sp.]|nr:hypothetical protein [Paludibacter sp.]